jgi:hypothetical protein
MHHVEILDIKPESYNCDGCLIDCKHTGTNILAPYPGDDGVLIRLCPSCASKFKESFNKLFSEDTPVEESSVTPVKINFWARLKRLIGLDG